MKAENPKGPDLKKEAVNSVWGLRQGRASSLAQEESTNHVRSCRECWSSCCHGKIFLKHLKRVEANKGSHGVDGMSVKSLREHIVQNWQTIRKAIEEGTYQPSPVRRVEIPKPNGGGIRMLGIPTVTDRCFNKQSHKC